MLGPPKERHLDRSIVVSLETLVPTDHFYRHLEAKLDLSFVREWVKDCYAPAGRPSIDPVVFFKLQLVLFFEGIRSERKLIETASLHLAHRWYLGYPLDEPLPDHSSLTRIRDRLGLASFRRFFEVIVEQCQTAGLVWGKDLYFDGTKVDANASLDSAQPRFAVEAHLQRLFGTEDSAATAEAPPTTCDPVVCPHQAVAATDAPTVPVPLRVPLSEETGKALDAANGQRHDWLAEEGRPDRRVKHGRYQRQSDFVASSTDPDAALMRRKQGGTHFGYHDHDVVDGGKARIILEVLVTPADVMDNQPMLDLLWRTCFRWKLRPHQVTGDTTYGTLENIIPIEDAGIRAYVPLPDIDARNPLYGPKEFTYDAARDVYTCPQGQLLPLRVTSSTERKYRYQADAAICNACPVKAACTTGSHGRQVQRDFDEAYLDRVRDYHGTAAYAKALGKRKVWVEPLFAEAKDWHGLRRFRFRRLPKVNGVALMIAAGQNLKRLLSQQGWGQRHWPGGAPGARLAWSGLSSVPL
jgi:transposase